MFLHRKDNITKERACITHVELKHNIVYNIAYIIFLFKKKNLIVDQSKHNITVRAKKR